MDARFAGPWPDIRPLVAAELDAYLAAVAAIDPALPTRCAPWTVRDVTTHLAATFERFVAMLSQGRRGDLTPPFAPEDMDAENLRAVRAYTRDPEAALREECERFLALASDPDEVMPHQRGPIPVGVQQLFGLGDLAVHHDDVAVAAGRSYAPPPEVVSALVASYRRLGWWDDADPPEWRSFVSERGT
ncbi:MAG TPA: maleylpyruvate isomerase family mycothiol-dependent enzyme [Frankiaceae bacterium]|nr:maleylpyruvate isomerase family mycothiol-dependent enzyme [Frankiaceae bacterium]